MTGPSANELQASSPATRRDCVGVSNETRIKRPPSINKNQVYLRIRGGELHIEHIFGIQAAVIVKVGDKLLHDNRKTRCVVFIDLGVSCEIPDSTRRLMHGRRS